MHRLTAKLLLLFALVGSFVPLALSATIEQSHACCLRKGAHPHHCSETGTTSNQFVISGKDCCDHNCCRAVTSAQWAHPQPHANAFTAQGNNVTVTYSQPKSPIAEFSKFQSARAPPFFSIA